MFLFGHLGFGEWMAAPWVRRWPARALRPWVLIGTLLPDLIDKPLYYIPSWITGLRGAELGWISGTRTLGHTLLFVLGLGILAWKRRSYSCGALSLGAATHLCLDVLWDLWGELWGMAAVRQGPSIWHAVLFPCLGLRFPVMPHSSAQEHLSKLGQPSFWVAEVLGLGLLVWQTRKRTREQP